MLSLWRFHVSTRSSGSDCSLPPTVLLDYGTQARNRFLERWWIYRSHDGSSDAPHISTLAVTRRWSPTRWRHRFLRCVWNPGPCTPSVIVGHTFGVNFCSLVHGVAEFASPASATLFGRFDPEIRNELNRADVN